MTQGYGPQDPNQPGYGEQPPSYPPQAPGQPPGYPPPPPPGYAAPPAPAYAQPGYVVEQPGYFMNRKLANWIQRVLAYLIDAIIPTVPYVLGWFLLVGTAEDGQASSGAAGLALIFYLVGLGLSIYNRWFLQGRTGQSWGKQVLRLRLVRMVDGQPVGAGMAFVRDLAHIVDGAICLIGYLFPLWDARRQTLADKIVNTVVLDES